MRELIAASLIGCTLIAEVAAQTRTPITINDYALVHNIYNRYSDISHRMNAEQTDAIVNQEPAGTIICLARKQREIQAQADRFNEIKSLLALSLKMKAGDDVVTINTHLKELITTQILILEDSPISMQDPKGNCAAYVQQRFRYYPSDALAKNIANSLRDIYSRL